MNSHSTFTDRSFLGINSQEEFLDGGKGEMTSSQVDLTLLTSHPQLLLFSPSGYHKNTSQQICSELKILRGRAQTLSGFGW